MRCAILVAALCAGAVVADLNQNQQARLDSLLKEQENAELAQLLSAKHRSARQDDPVTYKRVRKQTTSVFELGSQVQTLKAQFDNAVGSGAITDVITGTISDAIGSNQVLLGLVKDQAGIKAELTQTLNDAVRDAEVGLDGFISTMGEKIAGLTEGVAAQAAARAQIEKDLDSKLAVFQDNVDKQLKTLDSLPDTVSASVEDKLKPVASSIGILNRLKLTYLSDPKIPVFRWNWWHTHQHGSTSWFDGNNPRGYGGVHPSTWTDGNGCANDMNGDFKYLKRLFILHGTADKWGASICTETFIMHSSTTGRMCGVLWRIKNTKKSGSIVWNPEWMYSSFGGWSEYASVSLNGANNFRNHCNHNWCRNNINMNIPSNSKGDRISTVIFISSSTAAYHMGHSNHERANFNHFNSNSLQLADGLEFVDDLDTVTGNWKQ